MCHQYCPFHVTPVDTEAEVNKRPRLLLCGPGQQGRIINANILPCGWGSSVFTESCWQVEFRQLQSFREIWASLSSLRPHAPQRKMQSFSTHSLLNKCKWSLYINVTAVAKELLVDEQNADSYSLFLFMSTNKKSLFEARWLTQSGS